MCVSLHYNSTTRSRHCQCDVRQSALQLYNQIWTLPVRCAPVSTTTLQPDLDTASAMCVSLHYNSTTRSGHCQCDVRQSALQLYNQIWTLPVRCASVCTTTLQPDLDTASAMCVSLHYNSTTRSGHCQCDVRQSALQLYNQIWTLPVRCASVCTTTLQPDLDTASAMCVSLHYNSTTRSGHCQCDVCQSALQLYNQIWTLPVRCASVCTTTLQPYLDTSSAMCVSLHYNSTTRSGHCQCDVRQSALQLYNQIWTLPVRCASVCTLHYNSTTRSGHCQCDVRQSALQLYNQIWTLPVRCAPVCTTTLQPDLDTASVMCVSLHYNSTTRSGHCQCDVRQSALQLYNQIWTLPVRCASVCTTTLQPDLDTASAMCVSLHYNSTTRSGHCQCDVRQSALQLYNQIWTLPVRCASVCTTTLQPDLDTASAMCVSLHYNSTTRSGHCQCDVRQSALQLYNQIWTLPVRCASVCTTTLQPDLDTASAMCVSLHYNSTTRSGHCQCDVRQSALQLYNQIWTLPVRCASVCTTTLQPDLDTASAMCVSLHYNSTTRSGHCQCDVRQSALQLYNQIWTLPVRCAPQGC